MKKVLAIAKTLAVFAWVVFIVKPVAAQSPSPQALTWFKVGLTEKEPQKKIAAYMKALDYDPLFVEALYNLGLTFKKQQDYQRAEQYLVKAYNAKPEAEARAHLTLAASREKAAPNGNVSTYIGGAALLVLPLLGFVMFSPAARARLQLFRGNYLAAAQIYEKALTRQPQKAKLYPALANIYLLLGRNDENAIKIYKTILQLNLTARNRDEMSTILAQNYLTEGRTDSDAIAVLESALKAEQRRQQNGF